MSHGNYIWVDDRHNLHLEEKTALRDRIDEQSQSVRNFAVHNGNEVYNRMHKHVHESVEVPMQRELASIKAKLEEMETGVAEMKRCPPMEPETDAAHHGVTQFWGANAHECRRYCPSPYFVFANNTCYCKNSNAPKFKGRRTGHTFGQTCLF